CFCELSRLSVDLLEHSFVVFLFFFFFNDTATTEIYTLSLHNALPIWIGSASISQSATAIFENWNLYSCASSKLRATSRRANSPNPKTSAAASPETPNGHGSSKCRTSSASQPPAPRPRSRHP